MPLSVLLHALNQPRRPEKYLAGSAGISVHCSTSSPFACAGMRRDAQGCAGMCGDVQGAKMCQAFILIPAMLLFQHWEHGASLAFACRGLCIESGQAQPHSCREQGTHTAIPMNSKGRLSRMMPKIKTPRPQLREETMRCASLFPYNQASECPEWQVPFQEPNP